MHSPRGLSGGSKNPVWTVSSYLAAGLRKTIQNFILHYHAERNHQGKGNQLLFPRAAKFPEQGIVRCQERLDGLLKYYHRQAARGLSGSRSNSRSSAWQDCSAWDWAVALLASRPL